MLKLLLFVSICFAQGNYVKTQRKDGDGNNFADWKWDDLADEEDDTIAEQAENGWYKFDKDDFYTFGQNEQKGGYPQTEFYVRGGDKVYVKYDPTIYDGNDPAKVTHKIAYKPQDLTKPGTKFIMEIPGRAQDFDFGIYGNFTGKTEGIPTLRLTKCQGEGCSWGMWFGGDSGNDVILNIDYDLGSDETIALDKGLQELRLQNSKSFKFGKIRFNKAVSFQNYDTTILVRDGLQFNQTNIVDEETGTTCSFVTTSDTDPIFRLFKTKLSCTSTKGYTKEEEQNADQGGNGGNTTVTCDSTNKHEKLSEDGTKCVCEDNYYRVNQTEACYKQATCDANKKEEQSADKKTCVCKKGYKKEGDKCVEENGTFSTFILVILAILFFLF